MPSTGSSLGLGLFYVAFLLVPGYAAVQTSLFANRRLDDFDRFDKLVYSALWGVLTLIIFLLAIEPCWVRQLQAWIVNLGSNPGAWCTNTQKLGSVTSRPVIELLGVIIAQSGLGGVLGYIHGRFNFHRTRAVSGAQYARQPWDIADDWTEADDVVSVITVDGTEVKGRVHEIGSSNEDYDLLLRAPKHVQRGDDGQEESVGDPYANQIYMHHQDISRVIFHESYGIDEYEYETHRAWIWGVLTDRIPTTLKNWFWTVGGWLKKLLLFLVWLLLLPIWLLIIGCRFACSGRE